MMPWLFSKPAGFIVEATDADKLAHWKSLGVTEVLFGLPDKDEATVSAYVERLAGKLRDFAI